MRFTRTLALVGLGAALAYLLDPEHGTRRREELRQRLEGLGGPQAGPARGDSGATIVPTPESLRRSAGT